MDWDIHHGNGTQHLFESDPRYSLTSVDRLIKIQITEMVNISSI